MPSLTRNTFTFAANLGPQVLEYILDAIQTYATDNEVKSNEEILDKIHNKLLTDLQCKDENDTKYKVIMSRCEYKIRQLQPELCAKVYNQLFNAYEKWKQEHELKRKPTIRISMSIPKWRVISNIFALRAILVRKHKYDLTEMDPADITTIDIARRFEKMMNYEIENRGYRRKTHAV